VPLGLITADLVAGEVLNLLVVRWVDVVTKVVTKLVHWVSEATVVGRHMAAVVAVADFTAVEAAQLTAVVADHHLLTPLWQQR
jgi:hypothetical protein